MSRQGESGGDWLALSVLAAMVAAALLADVVARLRGVGPLPVDLGAVLAAPSRLHWLGTDAVGRDVAARVIHGARSALAVGGTASIVAAVTGLIIGTGAGYAGGLWDALVSRLLEVIQAFPSLLLMLAVLAALPRSGWMVIALVLGLTRSAEVARLARAEAMRLRSLDFVLAARALGSSGWRTLVVHVVPHALGPVLVATGLGLGNLILAESALAFLGLGAPPPAPSWGELLMEAREHPEAWWLAMAPGAALFATVAAANQLAESLRDAVGQRSNLTSARKLRGLGGSS